MALVSRLPLVFLLFVLLPWAQAYEVLETDKRQLLIETDGSERAYTLPTLLQNAPAQMIAVYDDTLQAEKKYWAINLKQLLNNLGYNDDQLLGKQELSFVCIDGYTVNSPVAILFTPEKNPWLALASAEASGAASAPLVNGRWQPYQHGSDVIGFDPFYLVWQTPSAAGGKGLPWPYQLAKIRLKASSDYEPLRPLENDSELNAGFELFTKHCIRCHQLQGIGGLLGPDLLREYGMLSALDDATLVRLITHVQQFFPATKMPDYSSTLNNTQAQSIVGYLRSVAAASQP